MNVFEKIIAGELPCKKVLENADFLCFHDISPRAKIHVLVVPKRSVRDFNDADPEMMAKIYPFMMEVIDILGIKNTGYKIITNTGEDGSQEVPHLHFHILGGEKLRGHF